MSTNPIKICTNSADVWFCQQLRDRIVSGQEIAADVPSFLHAFADTTVSQTLWGFAVSLVQANQQPLTVVRMGNSVPTETIRLAVNCVLQHRRLKQFHLLDSRVCQLILDFIPKAPIKFSTASVKADDRTDDQEQQDQGLRIVIPDRRVYLFGWQRQQHGLWTEQAVYQYCARVLGPDFPANARHFSFSSASYQHTPLGWVTPTNAGLLTQSLLHDPSVADRAEAAINTDAEVHRLLRSQKATGEFVGAAGSKDQLDRVQSVTQQWVAICTILEHALRTTDCSNLPCVARAIEFLLRTLESDDNHQE